MNYDTKIEHGEVGDATGAFDPISRDGGEFRASRKRAIIIGALALVVLLAIFFVLKGGGSDSAAQDREGQAPVVSVISPGRTTVTGKISTTGTLAARREEPVGVSGEGGQVARVLVEPGDWVSAGQVLATIDRSVQSQQAASMAAQVDVAEADARLSQSNLDRALKLVDRGSISRADLDRLTAIRDAGRARVRVARAQLGEMQAKIRRLDIVAPSAGLVLERRVEPGQVVSPGSGVLFRLAKDGEMELLARVGETDLTQLSIGLRASVVPVGSNVRFDGQIWQVSPVIGPKDRQGTIRVALAPSPALRPGGFATAEIAAGTLVAPLLPESALLADDKGSYVLVVSRENKVERRDVTTGPFAGAGIVVLKGLTGSEKIVQRAGAFLAPGETVKPKAAAAGS